MPFEYELDHQKKLVRSTLSGIVTLEDLLRHNQAMHDLFAEGTLNGEWMQLIRNEGARLKEHNPVVAIRTLARNNPWPSSCTRVVVNDNQFIFALCRMYQQLAYSGKNGLQFVRTPEEAEALLEHCRSQSGLGDADDTER